MLDHRADALQHAAVAESDTLTEDLSGARCGFDLAFLYTCFVKTAEALQEGSAPVTTPRFP